MKKYVSLAAVAAAAIASPAFGQTVETVGGPRIEATVGWDRVVLNVDGESGGKSGVTYGGEIGYDIALSPSIVAGAYAGLDGSSTKECVGFDTERYCLKAGRNITVGARLGTLVGANSLLYVKGGYSNGRLKGEYTDSASPADNQRGGENMDGFHVGAGVQVGLTERVYAKAEYNYTRYSTYEIAGYDLRLDRHRVLAGVGIGF